jgi:Uma2 family endonuclease
MKTIDRRTGLRSRRKTMTTVIVESTQVTIPASVVDHESFRRWARSDDFPEAGRVCFFNDEVWVDMSKEQIFSHNQVKHEYNMVLGGIAKQLRLGRYFPDGVLLSNEEAGLTCQPDGTFVSRQRLREGKVRLRQGAQIGYVELEGAADMVLEVVSASSVEKDTEILRELYARAGISEYWLVDARAEPLVFEILRLAPKGYVPVRKQGGWLKSIVFGKSFRLIQHKDELGHPEFSLEYR